MVCVNPELLMKLDDANYHLQFFSKHFNYKVQQSNFQSVLNDFIYSLFKNVFDFYENFIEKLF
ncbi:hypothetical protein A0H76_1446 [Hepatospora eriocheir]|uniref:Uncharacterized protein n=1 Tax=Hepatospora eriocheir TaxID=1081669 RepID=A0A1X0Q5U8_9MICR|nr:hypothetical protein A0H76_1446 [Hepatospora eriocheir]